MHWLSALDHRLGGVLNQKPVDEKTNDHSFAAVRNAAIGLLRRLGATNIAAALRENALKVNQLLTNLGILEKRAALPTRRTAVVVHHVRCSTGRDGSGDKCRLRPRDFSIASGRPLR